MGLMDALRVGTSGLRTSQNALNTTAHNLTNAETPGYVRQQTLLMDSTYHNVGKNHISTKQIGLGVETQVVRQVRDMFLDQSYRKEFGREGFYESQFEAADEMQEVMGELEGVRFQNSLKDFWVALQELAKEPDNIVTRATLIQDAVNFISHAETIFTQIETYQVELNQKIQTKVDRINEIGDKVAELNKKISFYECSKLERANDLRDERNMLLDELSGLIDISYREETDGKVLIRAETVPFVTEDRVFYMATRPISDDSEMLIPYWPAYGDVEVYDFSRSPSSIDDTDIGSLKGIILARGRKVGKYTDIPAKPLREEFDNTPQGEQEYNNALKQFEVDAKNYNKDIQDSVVMATQAQFDNLIHGIVKTINDILCPNKQVEITGLTTATGATSYELPSELTIGLGTDDLKKIKILDMEKAGRGMDVDKEMGVEFFSRKAGSDPNSAQYQPRYVKITAATTDITLTYTDENGTSHTCPPEEVWIYNEENPKNNYSLYTLGEIEVNPTVMKDRSKIPLSKNTNSGDFDIDVAADILSAWQAKYATLNPNELSYNNFNEYYRALVGELGTRGEKYKTIADTQEAMVTSIDNRRLQVMAVSSDEELTHLIKYQHAYNASARYVNVVSQMLEHIINTLGA